MRFSSSQHSTPLNRPAPPRKDITYLPVDIFVGSDYETMILSHRAPSAARALQSAMHLMPPASSLSHFVCFLIALLQRGA